MSDLVKRLREGVFGGDTTKTDAFLHSLTHEAATEIEKLRAALKTARRDALEEAAQRAKQIAAVLSNPSAADAVDYVTAAIRALGEKE